MTLGRDAAARTIAGDSSAGPRRGALGRRGAPLPSPRTTTSRAAGRPHPARRRDKRQWAKTEPSGAGAGARTPECGLCRRRRPRARRERAPPPAAALRVAGRLKKPYDCERQHQREIAADERQRDLLTKGPRCHFSRFWSSFHFARIAASLLDRVDAVVPHTRRARQSRPQSRPQCFSFWTSSTRRSAKAQESPG